MGKPFLRWAGGKSWLVKHLPDIIKSIEFKSYHELFLGGGSVFFSLKHRSAYLSDINEELINCYTQVRDNIELVIHELEKYQNTKEDYYRIRKEFYEDEVKQAARFIYLNQTSFNGIYRVNLKGEYNVPYGYRKKNFLDRVLLTEASKSLSGTVIKARHFKEALYDINEGDLVFLDPPYTITHNNNGFIKYNERLFKEMDQHTLSEFIGNLKEIGAYYILTNAAHYKIKEIFDHDEPIEMSRASLIGGKKAKRGNYREYLFTNI